MRLDTLLVLFDTFYLKNDQIRFKNTYLLKHIYPNLCCYAPENSSKLIPKSANMIKIDRTLPFPFQMTWIDSKVRDIIAIPGILTDLEINLDEFSGA